jgi:hypothetical protein
MPGLIHVGLYNGGRLEDLTPLSALRHLRQVVLQGWRELPPLDEWQLPPELRWLVVEPLSGDVDLATLLRFPALSYLSVGLSGTLRNLAALRTLPLRTLEINRGEIEGSLEDLLSAASKLTELRFVDCDWLADIDPLARFDGLREVCLTGCQNVGDFTALVRLPELEFLYLQRTSVADISFLARCDALTVIEVSHNPNLIDLSPLRRLPKLRFLGLAGNRPGLDLSLLAGRRGLTIRLYEGQVVTGTERLGRGVKIERVAAPANYDPYAPVRI